MANDITGFAKPRCLKCKSSEISIQFREFPYIIKGDEASISGVWGTETAICYGCGKAFVSEKALPPGLATDLKQGLIEIFNPTPTNTLTISIHPTPYIPTT